MAALPLLSSGKGSRAWENSRALPEEELNAFAKKHCLPTNLNVPNPLADTSIPTSLPQHRISKYENTEDYWNSKSIANRVFSFILET